MVREGFTCARLAIIHSSRVRTEVFPAAAASPGVTSLRGLPSSSKNNCSSTSATPMPSSPPATHIFRPRQRCELANETARGRTSRTKICCPPFPKGRCIRSTRDELLLSSSSLLGRESPSSEHGVVDGVTSVSPGVAFDAYTTMNAVSVSPSLSGSHVPGMSAGSSLGRSVRLQSSMRPPTFSTGVGNVFHAVPPRGPSLPEVCSISRAVATSFTTITSSSSRKHASNSMRCLQKSCGVRPCKMGRKFPGG